MYPYEGMFLLDPVAHAADPEGVEKVVAGLLAKHGAKVHQVERWDERKLAYEIKGHRRGVYNLAYFDMPGGSVNALRGDCRLNELILRVMIVRLDDDVPTYLEKSAKYYEKMREQPDERRRRDEEYAGLDLRDGD